jgi:chromosome segregation ATPase
MADDMANGDENARHYPDGFSPAAMGERISNLNRRQTDYEAESRANFRAIESSIAAITSEMRQSFNNISTTLAERSKPQWQAIGVALTFAVIIGGMAYWPIRESTTDLKVTVAALATETNQSIRMLAERSISREELDWRAARSSEDRARTDKAIDEIRTVMLPRAEWSERNLSRDHDIDNLRSAIERDVTNLQRQLDLQRSDFQTFANSMGNGRDFITDLKDEVNRMREQLGELRARFWQRSVETRTGPP